MEKELQNFANELEQSLGQRTKQLEGTLSELSERCLNKAGDNADKFVNCMYESTKKFEKEQKKFDFKQGFYQVKFMECVQKSGSDIEGVKRCKQITIENLSNGLDELIRNIRK